MTVGDELIVKPVENSTQENKSSNTLPAVEVTTDKTVYPLSNTLSTIDEDIHLYVKPIVDIGDGTPNTPVVKVDQLILRSKLLQIDESLELIAKDQGGVFRENHEDSSIKTIQNALMQLNFELGFVEARDKFCSMTTQTIKLFQKLYKPSHNTHADYSIGNADGIVGRNTLLALDEALQDDWSCIRYELRISRKKLYRRHSSINSFVGDRNKDLTVRAKQGGTLGEFKLVDLYNNDKILLEGDTLEADDYQPKVSGSDSYIPTGTYRMIDNPGAAWMPYRLVHTNKKSAKEVFGTRGMINIHVGNYPWNLEGCILLGQKGKSTTEFDTPEKIDDDLYTNHSGFEYPKIGPSGPVVRSFKDQISKLLSQTGLKTYDGSNATYTKNFYFQLVISITDQEMDETFEYGSNDNNNKYVLLEN